MTHLEATDLATRILERFQGPPGHVWEEQLATLSAGQAGTALARLTRDHESRYLTVGQFMAVYRSLATRTPETRGPAWDGPTISLDEYLATLTDRASRGDQRADAELETWGRWLNRQDTA